MGIWRDFGRDSGGIGGIAGIFLWLKPRPRRSSGRVPSRRANRDLYTRAPWFRRSGDRVSPDFAAAILLPQEFAPRSAAKVPVHATCVLLSGTFRAVKLAVQVVDLARQKLAHRPHSERHMCRRACEGSTIPAAILTVLSLSFLNHALQSFNPNDHRGGDRCAVMRARIGASPARTKCCFRYLNTCTFLISGPSHADYLERYIG